jgi:hypothetical protein
MVLIAFDPDTIYRNFVIETDGTGEFWVADKRGPNVVTSKRLATFADAQREWSRLVEAAMSAPQEAPRYDTC